MLRKLIGLGSLVVLTLSAAAMGCSSSSSGDATPPLPFPDFASFCTGVATAECSTAITNDCNVAASKCTSELASNCMQGNLDFAPSSVTSLYDANQGKPCIDALTSAFASAPISAASYAAVRKTCASAFSKKGPSGASCTVDNDCDTAGGLSCWFGNGTTAVTGQCAKQTMVDNGNDCSAPGSTCGAGYYCASVAQYHCINISNTNGSACSAVDPCGADEICDNVDASTGMGTCGSAHVQGNNCADDAQCDTGLVCLDDGAGAKECFAQLSFGPGSTTCNVFSEIITPAPANGGGGSGGSGGSSGAAGSGGAAGDSSTGGSAGAGGDSGGTGG